MTIASTGIVTFVDDIILKDAATIGVTSSTSAISIAATGIVTLVDDLILKDAATIGNASVAAVMTLASTGIVTFVDDIILKDAATIGVTSSTSAISIAATGIVTFVDDILIKDTGTIGSASTPAAIAIAANGTITTAAGIELGHASDTTIARSAAGVVQVEGVTVGLLAPANIWVGAQRATVTALSSSSNSIAIALLTTNDYSHTFTEDTTLANPSDTLVAGQSGSIFLTQHASSPKTLAFGSEYDFVGGTVPTVTAANSARDRLDYVVRADAKIEITAVLNLS
jgi:hypothetical protein